MEATYRHTAAVRAQPDLPAFWERTKATLRGLMCVLAANASGREYDHLLRSPDAASQSALLTWRQQERFLERGLLAPHAR